MAKVPYTKLGLKPNTEIKTIEYNGLNIEVKQYLPVNDKLGLISNVINLADDGKNYSNPTKQNVYLMIEIIEHYTNITFTEKQKEDPNKLYDALLYSEVWAKIINTIPQDEILMLRESLELCSNAIYAYQNSLMGMMETISTDYSDLSKEATTINEKISNPETMALLKGVLTKLG